MATPQHRALSGPRTRRSGWAGIAAAAALIVTSMGGVAFASAPQSDQIGPDTEATTTTDDGTTGGSGETAPTDQNTPPVEAPDESTLPVDDSDGTEGGNTDQGVAGDMLQSNDGIASALAVGPDRGTPPYVYWNVKDKDTGELMEGATFTFQYYASSWFGGSWNTGNNATGLADCVGTCGDNSLDRDGEGGEFLLEHRGTNRNSTNRIAQGSNYRVSQVAAPAGYRWVVSGDNTKTIGGNSSSTATWSGNTHNFGTFQVEKIPAGLNQPKCEAGYIYGISSSGQIRQVAPGESSATNFGTKASGVSSFNGLGIGSNGQPVFAYERSNGSQTATIWEFDTTAGTWSSTNVSVNSTTNSRSVTFVAGAVSLDNGRYYIGGFNSDGTAFRIWEYNPATKTATYKGQVNTSPRSSSANGDMAFDAAGNLYIVRGSGTTTTVFSVTKANLDAASGGSIPSSSSTSVSTMRNVNGVAFDSSGKAYLGSSSELRSYNMPNWSGSTNVVTSGLDSTDLASCSSPPTITIRKNVIGGRAKTNDQFKLELKQGSQSLGTETTTGSATGIQDKQVGPQPTVRNTTLTFTETGAGGANLATDYKSAYQCTVTHKNGTVQVLGQVDLPQTATKTGTIVIPATGEAVVCDFRNSPLTADVTINKLVTDRNGENAAPASGWEMGLASTATAGTVTQNPTGKQSTDNDGKTSWKLTFANPGDKANLNVSETMKPGYAFLEGSCLVTDIDGKETTVDINGPDAAQGLIAGVAPGTAVECTYVNKPIPGSLKIVKTFDTSVPENSGNIEFTGTYSCVLGEASVASGTWSRTGEGVATLNPVADNLPAGAECTVTEDELPVATAATGLPNGSYKWGEATIQQPSAVVSGEPSTATVTNKADRVYGNFSVEKVVPAGSVVDDEMKFGGNWTCTLDGETVTGTWGPIAPGEKFTSTDANKIPLGAECSATEENRTDRPVSNGSYEWDGDPVVSGSVVAGGESPVITVTNRTKEVPGSVSWLKVDGKGKPLAGSVWRITPIAPTGTAFEIEDCVEDPCAGPDMDPVAGALKVENLPWGVYRLEEKQAPLGYVLDSETHEFTINAETRDVVFDEAFVNNQQEGPDLPSTGGQAAVLFTVVGVVLLGGAGAVALVSRRRRA